VQGVGGGGVKSIRLIAIIYAVISSAYWSAIAGFVGKLLPAVGNDDVPYWLVGLINFVPAALYAVATLLFCHWFARRILRQEKNRSSE
jgi:hypothetical protein